MKFLKRLFHALHMPLYSAWELIAYILVYEVISNILANVDLGWRGWSWLIALGAATVMWIPLLAFIERGKNEYTVQTRGELEERRKLAFERGYNKGSENGYKVAVRQRPTPRLG